MKLDALLDDAPGLLGAILLGRQGEVLDVSRVQEARMKQLASFGIGLFELAERMAEDGGIGHPLEMVMQCEDGNLFMHDVGGEMMLLTLSSRDAPAGAIQHDLSTYVAAATSTTRRAS